MPRETPSVVIFLIVAVCSPTSWQKGIFARFSKEMSSINTPFNSALKCLASSIAASKAALLWVELSSETRIRLTQMGLYASLTLINLFFLILRQPVCHHLKLLLNQTIDGFIRIGSVIPFLSCFDPRQDFDAFIDV